MLAFKALLAKIANVLELTFTNSELKVIVASESEADTVSRWLSFGNFGSVPKVTKGPKFENRQYWIVTSEATSKTVADLIKHKLVLKGT